MTDFLHKVIAIVVLDEKCYRIFAKYYTVGNSAAAGLQSLEAQRALEMNIHRSVRDPKRSISAYADGDILLLDGYTVLYSIGPDTTFFVLGGGEENELVLHSVLRGFTDSLQQTLKVMDLPKRVLLENYDAMVLTVDEMVDEGIILEINPGSICGDVAPFLEDSGTESARKAMTTVKKYLKENL